MNFGVLAFNEVEELDFVGPWELLGAWRKHAGGPERCLIVAEAPGPVLCANGLSINPHVSFEQCPELDILLVPGGDGTRREVENPATVGFIAAQATRCEAVLSVCTGAFLLHRAGVLAGQRATTHWALLDRLRARDGVTVVEERFVRSGKIWSSAGVSAGTDLMLAFIADRAGEETAGRVQSFTEYYPSARRYGGFASRPEAPGYLKAREPA